MGVQHADSRRLDGIRGEIGMTMGLTERVIRGIGVGGACGAYGRLPKRAMSHVEVGRRGRGKPVIERDFK